MAKRLPDDDPWARPEGVDDATVDACGTLGEALERLERARGHLYEFHQQMGRADLVFGDAANELDEAGHHELAECVRREVVGRNVLEGRWTFQIVEEFDDGYYDAARAVEKRVRDELLDGHRHVYEAEMKERRRTEGHRHHERRPD